MVNSALYNVDAGHRAVIFDRFRGVQDVVVGEGTHFLIPWVQKPIIFDCRSRPRNVPVITGSKDLQNVNITLRNLFRPVASLLPCIYTSIGEDYDERFDAGELITQRELVSRQTFGKEFTEAVEAKQVAQQEAERARKLEAAEGIAYQLSRSRNITYLPAGQSVGAPPASPVRPPCLHLLRPTRPWPRSF
ncbi:Prohibitin 1 [Lemmus lemmus]